MQEIDSMDMLGFLKIRAWNAKKKINQKRKKPQPGASFIDKVWPGLRP